MRIYKIVAFCPRKQNFTQSYKDAIILKQDLIISGTKFLR